MGPIHSIIGSIPIAVLQANTSSMAGRKPKPTQLKLLQGNPGRRPINQDEPTAKAGCLRPPKELSKDARKHFRAMARMLREAKIYTELDQYALFLLSECYARWIIAQQNMLKYGLIVKTPNGLPIQSPYLQIANKAIEQMTRLLVDFGMTPSGRSSLKIDREKPIDPLELFINRNRRASCNE